MKIETLQGRTVTKILMEPGEGRMHLECADGDTIMFVTDGDCCSETWFADIVGVCALLNEPITLAEEVDIADSGDNRTRQEYDRFYGFKLYTAKGCCDFIYRNSSNGYYGGDCEIFVNGLGEHRYTSARFTLPVVATDAWCDITEDWQA